MSEFQPYSQLDEKNKSQSRNSQHSSSEETKSKKIYEEGNIPEAFVSRAEWRAKPPKFIECLELPVGKVVVSFTETKRCTRMDECIKFVQALQGSHMEEEDVPDIKYNFLIGGDGMVYEGRGYTRVGPVYPPSANRIELLNHSSIDVGIIGPKSQIVGKELRGLTACVSYGVERKLIDDDFETFYVINNEIAYIHSEKAKRAREFELRKPE